MAHSSPCFESRNLTTWSSGFRYARCGYVFDGPDLPGSLGQRVLSHWKGNWIVRRDDAVRHVAEIQISLWMAAPRPRDDLS